MAQNYDFGDMSNLGFSGPPQKLILNYFFLILLALIIWYKTNKHTKLYHDQTYIYGIMVARIGLKMSNFPIFRSYLYF